MINNFIKLKKAVILLLFSILSVGPIIAQNTIVKASIDSAAILIGDQTLIHLEVAVEKNMHVQFPVFPDTIIDGIEVLNMPESDTTDLGNNKIQIRQDYLITSFDSALYLIPAFVVVVNNDSIYSNSMGLKVSTFPVDTESKQFYDIKNVIDPPFVWKDYIWILWIILGFVLLSLIVLLIIFKLQGKPSIIPSFKKKEPELPPHIKAINKLDLIKSEKIWQHGLIKEYHSDITDTIRKYIEERFQTSALEMTSGEILSKIRNLNDADSVYENLKQILQLADFVKFAKYHPLPDENQLSLMNAYLFVNQTKKEEVNSTPEENKEEENNDLPSNEEKS